MGFNHAIIFSDSVQFRNARFDSEGNMIQPAIRLAEPIDKTFTCEGIKVIGGVCDLIKLNDDPITIHARNYFMENPNHCLTLNELLRGYREILKNAIGALGIPNKEKLCNLLIIGRENLTNEHLQMFKASIWFENENMHSDQKVCATKDTHIQFLF